MHTFGNVVHHHSYLRLHLQLFTKTLFSKIIKFVTNYVSSFCVYFAFKYNDLCIICRVGCVCLLDRQWHIVCSVKEEHKCLGEGGGGTGVTYFVRLSGGAGGGGAEGGGAGVGVGEEGGEGGKEMRERAEDKCQWHRILG